jgi:hypothetical protein
MTSTTTNAKTPNSINRALRQLARLLGWNRASYTIMGAFLLTLGLIAYGWWPLLQQYIGIMRSLKEWWHYIDWLLLGNFFAMSLLIMAGADLRADIIIVLVGFAGGLVIESWGTQTELWFYYTQERPPLWIIPAWPIASLAIDRLVRLLRRLVPEERARGLFRPVYWLVFLGFSALMLIFVWPTVVKLQSLTIMALILCGFLILTPKDYRVATLTFIAGSGLGYFLELWGTTRRCWTYYTFEQPPLFAVLAHGMAAVAFWRVNLLFEDMMRAHIPRLALRLSRVRAAAERDRP